MDTSVVANDARIVVQAIRCRARARKTPVSELRGCKTLWDVSYLASLRRAPRKTMVTANQQVRLRHEPHEQQRGALLQYFYLFWRSPIHVARTELF